MYVEHSRLFLLECLKHFRSDKLFPPQKSQAAEVPGGLLEWHFIWFSPQSFLFLVRSSVYCQMTTCAARWGIPILSNPPSNRVLPSYCSGLLQGLCCVYTILSSLSCFARVSHIIVTLLPVLHGQQKGKVHSITALGLFARKKWMWRVCVMSLLVVKQNVYCKYTAMHADRHTHSIVRSA